MTAENNEAVDKLTIQQLVPINSRLIRNPKNAVRKQGFQENSRPTYLRNEISDIARKWRKRVRYSFFRFQPLPAKTAKKGTKGKLENER